MLIQTAREAVYDAVVIGSGASGGMAAWNLTSKGARVLMLDAGTHFHRKDFWTHVTPYEWRERIQRGQQPPPFRLSSQDQPYLTPPEKPFDLWRVWGVGGKTNVWGRVSLRLSDLDFKGAERDGWEIPWPISYKDIAPYYDRVDQLIGVCGGDDDSDSLPGSRYHLPPPRPRCGEVLLRRAAQRAGIPIVAGRRAVLTRPHNGFAPCHYCGACGRGCDTASFFNSADHLIPVALKSGRLTLRTNAVAARILPNAEGLAGSVQYFDRQTKEEHHAFGKVIVLAASCIDSTRILLNSKSSRFPNGIGNASGVIGKYLCEQVRFHVRGFLPQLYGRPASNDDGIGGEHIYMPRFNHRGRARNYLRGFGSQFWGIGCQAGAGHFAKYLEGFGSSFKKNVKRHYPAWIEMHPYGEVLPRADNFVTVEGTPLDAFGVPLPKIALSIGDNERAMIEDMYDTALEIMHEARAELVHFKRGSVDVAGSAIHEHGTCRMGDDAKRSALNGFCQMHEVKNLFVIDGSAFPTATEKNPTLTILALAWRASDYLADELKKGNLV
jgi:choline dehydrogenase-like flavoprotein